MRADRLPPQASGTRSAKRAMGSPAGRTRPSWPSLLVAAAALVLALVVAGCSRSREPEISEEAPASREDTGSGEVFDREKFDQFTRRVESMTPEDITAWTDALSEASGEGVEKLDVLAFIAECGDLFQDDRFQRSASEEYLSRARAVPEAGLDTWQAALSKASDETLSRAQTLVYLIQIDHLFEQGRLQQAESTRSLDRLRTISQSEIDAVQERGGGGASKSEAVVSILAGDAPD